MGVPGLPILDGQDLPKGHFGFERGLGFDEAEPVADPVDVHVDANGGQVEADGDGQVRRLAADTGQLAKFLNRVRQHAAELFLQDLRQGLQVPRLVMVEADGIDQLLDLLDAETLEIVGGEGGGEEDLFLTSGQESASPLRRVV